MEVSENSNLETPTPTVDKLGRSYATGKRKNAVARVWIKAQNQINLNNKINFLKTHQAFGNYENLPFTNQQNTLGAIYLVRDPRDVLISYAKHMNQNLNETLDLVLEEDSKGI